MDLSIAAREQLVSCSESGGMARLRVPEDLNDLNVCRVLRLMSNRIA